MSDRYTCRIEWSAEDDAYVGRCLEFPLLGAHGESAREAGDSLNQYLPSLVQRHLAAASVEQAVHELSQAVSRIERRLETPGARGKKARLVGHRDEGLR